MPTITFKVSPDGARKLRAAAHDARLTVSEFVRRKTHRSSAKSNASPDVVSVSIQSVVKRARALRARLARKGKADDMSVKDYISHGRR